LKLQYDSVNGKLTKLLRQSVPYRKSSNQATTATNAMIKKNIFAEKLGEQYWNFSSKYCRYVNSKMHHNFGFQ
jgi:hypothetical protein